MKILIALSGGIDSSVVAHLLHSQGHTCMGVMMQLWNDPLAPAMSRALPTKCCSVEHARRARSVCATLGIPFYTVNMAGEFKRAVVDPFLEAHARGETPNPCIACNRHIKFGALLRLADALGCDALATGHYARIAEVRQADGSVQRLLLEAVDGGKDQSYYLYALRQDDLARIRFPLGSLRKSEVYALAEHFAVPIPETYRESQDLCFYPERTPVAFLKRYLPMHPGPIRTVSGEDIGQHEGLPLYTIGQRRGIRVGGQRIPLHVVRKDVEANALIVAPSGQDGAWELTATDLHWISWRPPTGEDVPFDARVHALGLRRRGILRHDGKKAHFRFLAPVRGIAPGQAMVLYRGEEVVGGGRITAGAVVD